MIQEDRPVTKGDTILIVDDYPFNLTTVEVILRENGFKNSVTASSGAEALSLVSQNPPDLILLDVMMPGMDGFEVCRSLQENEETQDIPVIMLTGKISPEDLKKGFDVGAVDYIEKPFEDAELIARVKSALKLKYTRDQLRSLVDNLTDIRPAQCVKLSGPIDSTKGPLKYGSKEIIVCKEESTNQFHEPSCDLIHDLKNPLTSLVTLLPIIRDRETDPELKKLIETVAESANIMKEILNSAGSAVKK
ncbi:MAG: response regulator [Halobacteriota archaeon]|nr:response regulator [Halobacteriota archaeon]